jgi:hypothetical protein
MQIVALSFGESHHIPDEVLCAPGLVSLYFYRPDLFDCMCVEKVLQ